MGGGAQQAPVAPRPRILHWSIWSYFKWLAYMHEMLIAGNPISQFERENRGWQSQTKRRLRYLDIAFTSSK